MESNIEDYVPCYNFAMVCPGIYRSAHPTRKNFRFLKALNLKSICYLCPEAYPLDNVTFCSENNIGIFHFNLEENREPFSEVRRDIVDAVMRVVMDTRNHPILIHCERGRHRTGVICGCVRKLQGWSLGSVYSDYTLYNAGKGRLSDQQFLDLYEPIVKVELPYIPRWLLDEFTSGPGGAPSSTSMVQREQLLLMGDDDGTSLDDTTAAIGNSQGVANSYTSPIMGNPQVEWATTDTLVGSRGTWAASTFEKHGGDPGGVAEADNRRKASKSLRCVSSTRSNVTLILCRDNTAATLLEKPTEPMVLAVRPQCSYVLAEHVERREEAGSSKPKKDKKDKADKADKVKDKHKEKDKDKAKEKEEKEPPSQPKVKEVGDAVSLET